jgi:hypothetical protein
VTEERSGERQQGASARPPTRAGEQPSTAGRPPSPQEEQKTHPYAFYVVALALVLALTVFVLVMLIFQDVFKEAAVITTALSTLFGIFGTVTGAYFGIKASNDTAVRSQGAIERANETANRALAELPPEVGKEIMRGEDDGRL